MGKWCRRRLNLCRAGNYAPFLLDDMQTCLNCIVFRKIGVKLVGKEHIEDRENLEKG